MDAERIWILFCRTGLPEAYSLYRLLLEGREAGRAAKPA